MPTPPAAPAARPAAPAPSTPDELRATVAAELRAAVGELVAYGDGAAAAHDYAGGQLLELLWGHVPHHCRSRCQAYTGPFPCSAGTPPPLAGMTRRPVEGTALLPASDFHASTTRAQRVYFEYQREVAHPGIEASWEWLTLVVAKVGTRAVVEALADLAASRDGADRFAWYACAHWHLAVGAYRAHPAGLTVVTTPAAVDAGYDPADGSPPDPQVLPDGVRPFAVCDVTAPYAASAVAALESARALAKYARLRASR